MKFRGRKQWGTAADQMSKGRDDMRTIMIILFCISKAPFCKRLAVLYRLCRFCLILGDWKTIRVILINVYFHSYPQIFWLFLFAMSITAINFFTEQYREIALTSQLLQLYRLMLSVTLGSSFSLLLPCLWLHVVLVWVQVSTFVLPFQSSELAYKLCLSVPFTTIKLHPPAVITSVILFYVTVLMNGIPLTWLCSRVFFF